MNFFQKIIFIFVDSVFDFLRRLTMPPPSDDMYFRPLAVFWPIGATVFIFLSTDMVTFTEAPPIAFYIILGLSIIAAIVLYSITARDNAPKWSIVFSLATFIIAIFWIEFIANILVDQLGLFGLIIGINPSYLGLTVLAWGNSVGDMVANIGVAKRGFARMAIVCCFAGPFFNLCIGLGLSMLKLSIER